MSLAGNAVVLRVYALETDMYERRPVYDRLVEAFQSAGIVSVVVLRAIGGYGIGGAAPASSPLHISLAMPVVVEVLDTAEKIDAAVKIARTMLPANLLTTHTVNIVP